MLKISVRQCSRKSCVFIDFIDSIVKNRHQKHPPLGTPPIGAEVVSGAEVSTSGDDDLKRPTRNNKAQGPAPFEDLLLLRDCPADNSSCCELRPTAS